jgi:hypothetical protein
VDLRPGRRFSLDPEFTFHRRCESLRAFFVEARPLAEVAATFGHKPTALNVMISRFNPQVRKRCAPPFSSRQGAGAHPVSDAVTTLPAPGGPPSRISGF